MCIYLQQSFDHPEVVGDPVLVTGHKHTLATFCILEKEADRTSVVLVQSLTVEVTPPLPPPPMYICL